MNKIYHVFVSSTYKDLYDERRLVSEAIARAGYVPEGMEIFPASSQKQIDFITQVIKRCDYYILIIAGKYGSIYENETSYTRKEYEIARELGIPVLPFLHSDIQSLAASAVESDEKKARLLRSFRETLEKETLVGLWTTGPDLAAQALAALAQEANRNPRIGWVRGSEVPNDDVYRELDQLRRANAELESQIHTKVAVEAHPTDGSDKSLTFDSAIKISFDQYLSYNFARQLDRDLNRPVKKRISITPREVLVSTALAYREYNSDKPLTNFISAKISPPSTYRNALDTGRIDIDMADIEILTMAMCSLGLWTENSSHGSTQFKLTELGQRTFIESKIS